MGQGQSKDTNAELTSIEMEEAKVIQEKVAKDGPHAIEQHIRESLDNWQNETVHIGVSGRYKTGKSTFINAVLGLKAGQLGAAKSGSGNTTLSIEAYNHPTNPKIVMYDFPGVGSPEFPKKTYMNDVKNSKCDYFMIFFDSVISEDDLWLAENLSEINKPFCFVRSMIDQDIANAEYDGKDSSAVLGEIREKIATTMLQNDTIKNSDIFFISGRHTNIGEFDLLLKHMEKKLPPIKFDAIIFSISTLTEQVIEKKYAKLKLRLRIVSVGAAAISAIPVPGVDLAINLALIIHEIKHYIKTFCLDKYRLEHLPPETREKIILRSIIAGSLPLKKFILTQLGKAAVLTVLSAVGDLVVPAVGSIVSSITTLYLVHRFLGDLLEDFRHDALTFNEYAIRTQARVY